ncbi:MAG: 2-keto-3-deoxy-galactonokinase, partial [Cytophagales bacterium CG18_big_fil_WC_8_21_14_2_50_42_9]
MDLFLSCDWGTSSFRLRLIQLSDLKIIAEEKTGRGIAETYQKWKQTGGNEADRFKFYQSYITDQIGVLSKKANIPLDKIPVMLSGMASSTIGMLDLAYKELPFSLDGSDLKTEIIQVEGANKFIIISGARTEHDVMRGEETKVVGCSLATDQSYPEKLLILPGTHPKHIIIKDNQVIGFKTYMTGEFFDLLANQSVLSASVEKGGDFMAPEN